MNYGRLLSRAWEITWHYKFLWVFGFILAFFSGESGPSFNSSYSFGEGEGQAPSWLTDLGNRIGSIDPATFFSTFIVAIIALVVLGLLFWFAGIVLSAIARGALIGSVWAIEQGASTGFKTAFSLGWQRAISLIGIDIVLNWSLGILAFIAVSAVLIWMLWPIIPIIMASVRDGGNAESLVPVLLGTIFSGLAALCCLILILIPVSVIIGLVFVIATNICIIEKDGALRSIGKAWTFLKRNPGPVLLIWIIVVVIHFMFGLIVGLPVAVAVILLLLGVVASQFNFTVIIVTIALGILLGLVFLFLSGILKTYSSVLWTLAYLEIEKKGVEKNVSLA